MSVYSMTGYAAAQSNTAVSASDNESGPETTTRLAVELRSVNSRFLDLAFRLPDELRHAEPALRDLLTAKLRRGKVELRASLESASGSTLKGPSPATLQRLGSLQDSIQCWLPNAASLSVSDVMRIATNEDKKPHEHSDELSRLTKRALKDLLAAREREGTRLRVTLLDRTAQLRALSDRATPLVPALVEQQKNRFIERWQEAMATPGGAQVLPEAAQDRALAEATAYALRIDVAEEVTRLLSHLYEIDRLLEAGGELGKRLDFFIQELHREANTLGAKSGSLEMTRLSVDMKVLIEQIREQVQNIE